MPSHHIRDFIWTRVLISTNTRIDVLKEVQVSQLFNVIEDSRLQEIEGDVQFLLDKTDDLENPS